jgi:hypothetical protein
MTMYKGSHSKHEAPNFWAAPSAATKSLESRIGLKPTVVEVSPGECIVFHPSMMHSMHWSSTKEVGDFRLQSTFLLTPYADGTVPIPPAVFDLSVPPIRTYVEPGPGPDPDLDRDNPLPPYTALEKQVFVPAATQTLRCFQSPDTYVRREMIVKETL